ncbi:MAG: hypothetical protein AB2598_20660 [Candidatus Thiodiazotropha sp.]
MEVAEISPGSGAWPRQLSIALLLSIGFHLLLLQLGNWLQQQRDALALSPLPRPLSITIATPGAAPPEPGPQPPAMVPATTQTPQKRPQSPMPSESETPTQTTAEGIRKRVVTSAQIRRSAAAVIQELTKQTKEEGEGERKEEPDPLSAILRRALNKPHETPGVYTQADGTTRVVTENGFTYCVKPLDDWRIVDPEDDMRVSVYCN